MGFDLVIISLVLSCFQKKVLSCILYNRVFSSAHDLILDTSPFGSLWMRPSLRPERKQQSMTFFIISWPRPETSYYKSLWYGKNNDCGKNKFQNHPNIECFHQSFSLISSLHVCSLDFTKLGSRELLSIQYSRVESLRLRLKIRRIPFPLHSFYLEFLIFYAIFKLYEKWSYRQILVITLNTLQEFLKTY